MAKDYDFAGWVTKNDILCTDGVVIKENAFIGNDDRDVPLVWNHVHNDPKNVLGHIHLQNRREGVYGYGYFNGTAEAEHAKDLVKSGDIVSMSIAANKIKKNGRDVIHGNIYEVSLVLAGANDGAKIEFILAHSDDEEESLLLQTYEIIHAADYPDEESDDLTDNISDDQQQMIDLMDYISNSLSQSELSSLNYLLQRKLGDKSFDITDPNDINSLTDDEADEVFDYITMYIQNGKGEKDMGLKHSDETLELVSEVLDVLDDKEVVDVANYINALTGNNFANVADAVEALDEEDTDNLLEYLSNTLEQKAEVELYHSDDESDDYEEDEEDEDYDNEDYDDEELTDEEIDDIVDTLEDEDVEAIYDLISELSDEVVTADNITEILNDLDDVDQANVLSYMSEIIDLRNQEVEHSMNYNVFSDGTELQHAMGDIDDLKSAILDEAQQRGSLRDAMIAHGVTNIESLVTAEPLTGAPGLQRPAEPSEVDKILSSVKKIPKLTVKGRWADITTEEARAKGYIKGDQKVEEVFTIWNRETHPQTIYKLQSIADDDLNDIYDFDYMAFVKAEMKDMWRYELCTRIFFEDNKASSDRTRVDPTKIRPITSDNAQFNTKVYNITPATFIETVLVNKAENYRGGDSPVLYADAAFIIKVRLLKDDEGRYVYGTPMSNEQLAALLGVKDIVTPRFFQGTGMCCMVDLNDYELATKNEGKQRDSFDLQYNLHRFLFEGRVAGALNTPKSALTFTTEEHA